MRIRRPIALLAALLVSSTLLPAAKKKKNKKDELPDQTLELPKELPSASVGETAKLLYRTTPLSKKGLLSQQVRDGLKELLRVSGGGTVVHLRAFVAGTGDLRRVPAIVSETFTAKKLPLPTLTVVQVGALPLEGAQVLFEAFLHSKKAVNPNGIAFFPGTGESSPNPLDPVAPLAEKTIPRLRAALGSSEAIGVSCFASAMDAKASDAVRTAFPGAAIAVVQSVRAPAGAFFECEAVARLASAPSSPVDLSGNAARLNVGRIVFSGSQMAFHSQDADIRLAFQRLDKGLATAQSGNGSVVFARFYSLTRAVAEKARKIQPDFFRKAPPTTTVLSEGLPSLDASICMDVIAAPSSERP